VDLMSQLKQQNIELLNKLLSVFPGLSGMNVEDVFEFVQSFPDDTGRSYLGVNHNVINRLYSHAKSELIRVFDSFLWNVYSKEFDYLAEDQINDFNSMLCELVRGDETPQIYEFLETLNWSLLKMNMSEGFVVQPGNFESDASELDRKFGWMLAIMISPTTFILWAENNFWRVYKGTERFALVSTRVLNKDDLDD
jgi:hypothetical protein